MMIPFTLLILLSLFTSAVTYRWPDYHYDDRERLLFEGRRSDGSSLASIVNPCRKRTGTLTSIAAEWLRFVSPFFLFENNIQKEKGFHDMATYNILNGTGGLDGSLVYELDREEVCLSVISFFSLFL